MLYLYEHKHIRDPHDCVRLDDTADTWEQLLNAPEVIDDDGKDRASVLCGAKYFDGATSRAKENIDGVTCLVLDVDAGVVPDAATLRAALDGYRAVVYASPSHTTAEPRWRVLLPLASAVPPKKHRALVAFLSENLVAGMPGVINVAATADPCRLGFVGVTKYPEDYVWWCQSGAALDWTGLALEDEVWASGPLGGLERSTLWTDRPAALKSALKHFSATGQGLGRGQGRSDCLWKASSYLWWAYAAEDEEFVLTVLRAINANFAEPEADSDLVKKLVDSHKRTLGEGRKVQSNGTYGWAREPTSSVSWHAISDYARRLRQRRNPEALVVGDALLRLSKGSTLSDDLETWRGLLTKCAHELAKAFPFETSTRIAAFFRPSLATMCKVGALLPSEEEIEGYVGARLEGLRKVRADRADLADAKTREQIDFVTRGERSTQYTRAEVVGWEGVGLAQNTWVLVTKSVYFVFCNGSWVGPYTRDEFDAQGYKLLAAANDVGLHTQTFNAETGQRSNIPLAKILHEYGSACATRIDMNCEKTWFDATEQTLVLAGPARRDLQPQFHEDVDAWLRVMTERAPPANSRERLVEAARTPRKQSDELDNYDAVCDWLACLTQLDRPCAALYLEGNNSVGKGLFADGCSRIWKVGATPFEDAFHEFNSLLAETPFVWVDEGLPASVRASVVLRKALAARDFVYKRKYADAGKITGCLRMLFTSNNTDLFTRTKELLKKADIDALGLRFVHIKVSPEAATFLKSIYPMEEAFVEKNMIAEHALWLQEKRWPTIKARGFRFLVRSKNSVVADVIATNNAAADACCSAICETLIENRKAEWCIVRGSELLVNANLLRRFISMMQPGGAQYTEREVVRVVASISSGESTVCKQNGKCVRVRPLRLEALQAWCGNTGIHEWADVLGGLARLGLGGMGGMVAVGVA